jgi:phenylacetate-CoA ligase
VSVSFLGYIQAYGLYPLVERWLGRDIRTKLRCLIGEAALPFSVRRQLALDRLAETIRRAARQVPYYRDLFRGRDLADPLAWFGEIPYLTKDAIRAEGKRLLSETFAPANLHLRKTGGSTGPSACIFYSSEGLDWTAAADRLVGAWAGRACHQREVHLSSRFPEVFPWRDRLRERIKCAALNRVNLVTDRFDDRGLRKLWRGLCRARPYLVRGHPSTLYALALYLRRHRLSLTFPLFESTGETLDARKRKIIEETFDCRVVNRYGSAEFGIAAYSAPGDDSERLRVLDGLVWPETLRGAGGEHELVLTSLRNQAMPLIRYRTGDLAELTETDEGVFLAGLRGRIHDVIRIGMRNYPTHYVQDLLDRLGGIDEFQFEVSPGERPLLRLAVASDGDRTAVGQAIRRWWGDAVQIEFTSLDQFRRQGKRNKFRYVVTPPNREEAA